MDELNIAESSNNNDEFFDLETLITEGADARVLIDITFPDDRKAQALIRPITTNEFTNLYQGNVGVMLKNVLVNSLLNKNGEPIDPMLIDVIPIGVTTEIVKQIFDISGIKTNPNDADKLKKELELFP